MRGVTLQSRLQAEKALLEKSPPGGGTTNGISAQKTFA
jgi:hypothetical protein